MSSSYLPAASQAPGRPLSTRAQQLQAFCAVLTASAACIAAWHYIRAENLERTRSSEEAVARIYPLETALARFLAENPDLHVCLEDDRDGVLWKNQYTNERVKFRCACAMVADELEYYLLIRESIKLHPKGTDLTLAWDENLKGYCVNSYGFRSYIDSNRAYWTPMFLAEFDKIKLDLNLKSEQDLLSKTFAKPRQATEPKN